VMSLPKVEMPEHLQGHDHVMHEDEDNVQSQAIPDTQPQNHSQHKHSH